MNALQLCQKNYAKAKEIAAQDHAAARVERFQEGWLDRAVAFIEKYCHEHPGAQFLTEDIREAYLQAGFLCPPDNRIWGHVMRKAAGKGIVRSIGTGSAASSNNSPKVKWEAVCETA